MQPTLQSKVTEESPLWREHGLRYESLIELQWNRKAGDVSVGKPNATREDRIPPGRSYSWAGGRE